MTKYVMPLLLTILDLRHHTMREIMDGTCLVYIGDGEGTSILLLRRLSKSSYVEDPHRVTGSHAEKYPSRVTLESFSQNTS